MTSYWQAMYRIQGLFIMEIGLRLKINLFLFKKKNLKVVKSPKQNEDSLSLVVRNLFYTYILILK